jgi:hypothetical protein
MRAYYIETSLTEAELRDVVRIPPCPLISSHPIRILRI